MKDAIRDKNCHGLHENEGHFHLQCTMSASDTQVWHFHEVAEDQEQDHQGAEE
jgi:hypothetical protein